jgi:SAM-dependent methyltransferase
MRAAQPMRGFPCCLINNTEDYVSLMRARAAGALPDMGCALRVLELLKQTRGGLFEREPRAEILDVGCAAGHFLRTFIRCSLPLAKYVGLEVDSSMVAVANEVWAKEIESGKVEFINEDLEKFRSPRRFDVVICSNAFMYFASAKTALTNLLLATRRRLLIRSYFADASYRIVRAQTKRNHDKSSVDEIDAFDDAGNMLCYDFWNIYSQTYIEELVPRIEPRARLEWIEDKNVISSLEQERTLNLSKRGATEILAGQEISYPFILPWKYLSISMDTA